MKLRFYPLLLLALGTACLTAAPSRVVFPNDSAVLDVKRDFGAVGNGVADDTIALQNGLAASWCSGGPTRVLFIPNGTYRVTSNLVVTTGVGPWVYGESRDGVVIRLADGVPTNVTSVLRAHPSDTTETSADFFMRSFASEPATSSTRRRGSIWDSRSVEGPRFRVYTCAYRSRCLLS